MRLGCAVRGLDLSGRVHGGRLTALLRLAARTPSSPCRATQSCCPCRSPPLLRSSASRRSRLTCIGQAVTAVGGPPAAASDDRRRRPRHGRRLRVCAGLAVGAHSRLSYPARPSRPKADLRRARPLPLDAPPPPSPRRAGASTGTTSPPTSPASRPPSPCRTLSSARTWRTPTPTSRHSMGAAWTRSSVYERIWPNLSPLAGTSSGLSQLGSHRRVAALGRFSS